MYAYTVVFTQAKMEVLETNPEESREKSKKSAGKSEKNPNLAEPEGVVGRSREQRQCTLRVSLAQEGGVSAYHHLLPFANIGGYLIVRWGWVGRRGEGKWDASSVSCLSGCHVVKSETYTTYADLT